MRIESGVVSVFLGALLCAFTPAMAQQQDSETGDSSEAQQAGPGGGARRFSPEQRQRLREFIQRRGTQRGGFGKRPGGSGQNLNVKIDPEKVKAQIDVPYASDPRQRLDVYQPKTSTGKLPVLLFVHGGGWSRGNKNLQKQKGVSYAENGVIAVNTNYRLAPNVQHPKQVEDIASAFAWIESHATELGADTSRIYIMGHSAGAQLVDLLGTNERFLKEKGFSLKDIRGVISLDTASLNLGQRLIESSFEGQMVGDMIKTAFGTDPKVLADASPTLCIHPGTTYPPFLMFCGERRKDCVKQHEQFAESMKKAGGQVTVKPVPLSHGDISKEAGTVDSDIFKDVMAMIKNSEAKAK